MTLTKNKMIREIGQRTRLKNRDVQMMIEVLIDIWTDELVSGGRIELENFIVLETQLIDRGIKLGVLNIGNHEYKAPRYIQRVNLRTGKALKEKLRIRRVKSDDPFEP